LPEPEGIPDCTQTMLDAARQNDMEAVISFRMNDTHDALGSITYPFKLKHPEMLIEPEGTARKYGRDDGRYFGWSAMNYACEEVRRHKLDYIARMCERYYPDGIELDFYRHPVYFRWGEEEDNLPVMTGFVRRIRQTLDEIGRRRGRPILLVARLGDTPEKSIGAGLDGPTWLADGLLDVLIVGGGYAPCCGAWTAYRDLARRFEVPAYPCINCSLIHRFGSVEPLRGAAVNWLHDGAPGIYLFNPFVPVLTNAVPRSSCTAN